ncbi:response regulator [Taibaiella soli]|uniref:Response regulator n=1 Tax=Taibaiella soli TaxID=1649169 RepID=A0A2W2AHF8_9BACT|nr:response regulator [Taibaiella soli]PZF74711.1 response regulator [Taibaiella soli]
MTTRPLRVSLIDDDPIFRLTTGKMLRSFEESPVEIMNFENGLEAIEYFRIHQNDPEKLPDVMFIDINMPFMSGWELLNVLTEENIGFVHDIPVYMLSSSTSKIDQKQADNYSFLKEYLVKPVKKEQFFEMLRLQINELQK